MLVSSMSEPSLLARIDETASKAREWAARGGSSTPPAVGLVLGSGLGGFADTLDGLVKVPYHELPHLPVSKVVGHSGNLCFGSVGGVPVVCMQGRVHLYEGHGVASVVHGARTMARLGVGAVLVTNAAGGIGDGYAPGDLMVISDHLNLTGQNPLVGPNDDALGVRFPDMSTASAPPPTRWPRRPGSPSRKVCTRACSAPPTRRPPRSACSARWARTPSA